MNTMKALTFPALAELGPEISLDGPVEQLEYLVNGEIRLWDGPVADVLSPICEETSDGPRQIRIGSYPMFGEAEAMASADALSAGLSNASAEVVEAARGGEKVVLATVRHHFTFVVVGFLGISPFDVTGTAEMVVLDGN